MFYIVIGIVLLLLSAGTIAVMVLFEIRDRRAGNIQQGKRLPKKPYSKAFLAAIPRAYESAGTLRGMLTLWWSSVPKKMDGQKQPWITWNTVGIGTMKRHWLICQIPVLFVKNKSGRC